IAQVFRNTHAFWHGRIRQCPEFGEITREQVLARLDWLEQELAAREYFAGPRFTVADITALCAIDFGKVSNIRLKPDTHPNLAAVCRIAFGKVSNTRTKPAPPPNPAAWHARDSTRPSAKA